MADEAGAPAHAITRRRFVQGLAASTLVVQMGLDGRPVAAALVRFGPEGIVLPDFARTARRYTDQLLLNFSFYNLQVSRTSGSPLLKKRAIGPPAFIVVTFGPQSLHEEAILVDLPDQDPPDTVADQQDLDSLTVAPGLLRARAAAASRIALKFPDALGASIPFSLDALLDWSDLALSLHPLALPYRQTVPPPVGDQTLRAAQPTETSIELPWRLSLSPVTFNAFEHTSGPVIHDGRTELWHTRLTRKDGDIATTPAVRAVWAPDPDHTIGQGDPKADGYPFESAMTPRDRWDLVRLTSDWTISGYVPQAIPVDRLMLTPLGGYLSLHAQFDSENTPMSLEDWRHRTTLGRDHYVRIVHAGYLMPFGHPAVFVAIAERRIAENAGAPGGYLFLRKFLIVRRDTVDLTGGDQPSLALGQPFRSVTVKTLVTPTIYQNALGGLNASQCFVPSVNGLLVDGGREFKWPIVATDFAGNEIHSSVSMAFVDKAQLLANTPAVLSAWNAASNTFRRTIPLSGQRVTFAPTSPSGDTTLESVSLSMSIALNTTLELPRFAPKMANATVRPRLGDLTGATVADQTITYDSAYLTTGFNDSNKGEVWAMHPALPVAFTPDRSGGTMTPNFSATALSRKLGPVGGTVSVVRQGTFSVASFFDGNTALLLGGIKLMDVISDVSLGAPGAAVPASVPTLQTRSTSTGIETALVWHPALRTSPGGVFDPAGASARIEVRSAVDELRPTSTTIEGTIDHFALHLPEAGDSELIKVPFRRLAFTARDGQKPDLDVDVDAAGIEFFNELRFIEVLAQYLSFVGDSGPFVRITPAAIEAGVAVEIPNVVLGVFTLENIAVSAMLQIPLTGEPVLVHFALSSREDPFRLTVFGIGGGGYVRAGFGVDGLRELELSLMASASVGLDLGPISASIGCDVGLCILITIDDADVTATFYGFFRMYGEVDAGIASASIELYMELGYRTSGNCSYVYGRASLVIEVSVFPGIGGSIEVEVERSFQGSQNDPTFEQLMPAKPVWDTYAMAFAPLAPQVEPS